MTVPKEMFDELQKQIELNICVSTTKDVLQYGVELLKSHFAENIPALSLHSTNFNLSAQQIEVVYLKQENTVTIVNESDIWHIGVKVNYNQTRIQVLPYFICNAGEFALTHMSVQRYFGDKKYQPNSYKALFNKVFAIEYTSLLSQKITLLQQNNVSLREFYNIHDLFEFIENKNEIIEVWNNNIVLAYADIRIKRRNKRWLSTANTNVNAYEFLKLSITILNSGIFDACTKVQGSFVVSELFFNGPDLINRAPDPFVK
jgi:hypothetical protein